MGSGLTGGERILLADDHELVRETIADYLEREGGFAVTQAADHASAMAKLRARYFSLVLTDWQIPGMNGLDSLAELVLMSKPYPVALMSGTVDRRVVDAALSVGAVGYLPKAMAVNSLIHAVRLMLAGETYVPISHLKEAARSNSGTRLSPREAEVLGHLCRGLANKEIARELGLAEVTVKLHVRTLCRKLQAKNRTHAAMLARGAGFA